MHPLKFWSLKGFRAIRDETRLNLGDLNVLVGANSAGKSSVLHSILMTAQTLATPTADRALVLNGSLVRLGLPNDCVHEQTADEISIGFGLDPSQPKFARPALREAGRVEVEAHFDIQRADPANFGLAESKLTAHLKDAADQAYVATKRRPASDAKKTLMEAGANEETATELSEKIGMGVLGDVSKQTVGVYARQFLPDTLAVLANAYKRELNEIVRMMRPRLDEPLYGRVRNKRSTLSEPVASFLHRFLTGNVAGEFLKDLPPASELTPEHLSSLPEVARNSLAKLHQTSWFDDHSPELSFQGELEQQLMLGVLDSGVDFVRAWFSEAVHHLGPLRAEPQPLYSLPEAASGTSVGRSGEYTAAVLSTYGKRRVSVPMPNGRTETVSLGHAVDRWMAELGLLAAVRPRESGKFGYELNVNVEGVEKSLDLTTVGVGVSQALPVVVLGLIAESGSLLLFEQPELHLHPNVQAALGDFFLALARSGRQIILETHSEYLINRLRRRQVTDEEPDAARLVRLFFFERAGATTDVMPAEIGADGSMPAWPQGFLDTAAREVQAMVLKESD